MKKNDPTTDPITTKKALVKELKEIVTAIFPRLETRWKANTRITKVKIVGLADGLQAEMMVKIADRFAIVIPDSEEQALLKNIKSLEDGIWQKYVETHLAYQTNLLAPCGKYTLDQAEGFERIVRTIISEREMKIQNRDEASVPIQNLIFEGVDVVEIIHDLEGKGHQRISDEQLHKINSYSDLEEIFAPEI